MHSRLLPIAVLTLTALVSGSLVGAPAAAAGVTRIEGVVSGPGDAVPDAPVRVVASSTSDGPPFAETLIDPDTGFYELDDIPNVLHLRFEYLGSANIVTPIDSIGGDPATNGPMVIAPGETTTIDAQLYVGASVSGIAIGEGGVQLDTLTIQAWWNSQIDPGRVTFDPATGAYTLDRLRPNFYRLEFGSGAAWKGSIPSITLAEGEAVSGQDVVLEHTTTISGTVSYRSSPSNAPGAGITMMITNTGSGWYGYAISEADGSYEFNALSAGTYTVCATSFRQNAYPHCWDDQPQESATTITVAEGEVVSGIDVLLEPAASVRGTIVTRMSPDATPAPLLAGRVTAYRLEDGVFVVERFTGMDGNGGFALGPLTPGTYRFRFTDLDGIFNSEYWEDTRYWGLATEVELEVGETLQLPEIILEGRHIDVYRSAGQDRFDVGVTISQARYPEVPDGGVPVVYVANGYNFPDALVAGPAAGRHGGVVLLVDPDSIPTAVRNELLRLDPQRIVVAGGPASVSPAVFEQLKAFVPTPSAVTRANGADRYEASRNLIRQQFLPEGAEVAFITTGANFPDALSAGPAAALLGGPVILVDGSSSSLDLATRQLLIDLGIQHVFIAGGTGSVHPGIETSLNGLLGAANVDRFAGVDRYDVGVQISQAFFEVSDFAFVATSHKFPDALTGGPLAAAYGAPLYLSTPECLPRNVGYDILDLDVSGMWLLGGPASLTPAIEQFRLCG